MTSDNQDSSRNNALRMQTDIFSHQGELVWSVKDFSKFKDETLVSNEFSIVPCCQVKFEIILLLRDTVSETSISIKRKDKVRRTFQGDIQCFLENSKGIVYGSYAMVRNFMIHSEQYQHHSQVDLPPTEREDILNWDLKNLQEDLLIIKFQIKLENCCTKTETIRSEYHNSFPKHKLSTDLHRGLQMLLNEKPLSDVTLNVNGTIITAHKAILCARSPVFQKELESNMKEARDGVIEIKEIQPEIMKEFISYLYTDTIGKEVSLDAIFELYAAADKYAVGSLQDKCGSVLLENLNEKTVCKTLKLADLHNDDVLKEAASMYIGVNYAVLKHTLDFKSLVESDPRLILHVLMCKCLE